MKSWPERLVSNLSDDPATASWVGDQWCQYHFEGSYITCGSTTCFPGAMTISERPRKQGATANSWVPSGNQWDCSNGCDISFVGGTWLYDCGGANTGELGGGGGNGVNPPGATLTCTPSVVFGGVATCVVSIDGYAEGDDEVRWSFKGVQPYIGADTSETNYSLTWQGQVAASGIVTASITANGVPYSGLSDTLNVSPRTGWSWANSVTGRDGTAGEIDACFEPVDVGLTTAATCNSDSDAGNLFSPKEGALDAGNGVTFDVIDTQGPNQGFWYISAVTATMDLRAQLVKRWRESGDASAYTLADTLVL